jgi:hypothetical protein
MDWGGQNGRRGSPMHGENGRERNGRDRGEKDVRSIIKSVIRDMTTYLRTQ